MAIEKVELLLQLCRESGVVLRTAESCTAGAVAARLASVSGASDVLDRGWVTYSNQSKMDELGVCSTLLESHGAVSEVVVRAMAEGAVRQQSRHVCSIAISGIAGPSGGTIEKPIGTVWMAVLPPNKGIQTKKFLFQGSRSEIQQKAVDAAINFLFYMLNDIKKESI